VPRLASFPCAHQQVWLSVIGVLATIACATPQAADPDVVRPLPGAPLLERLPGPLLIFDSYQSALLASCQKIISKPRTTAGRRDSQGFDTRWRIGTEYCAWIYYTPDSKYVLSKLTDQRRVGLPQESKKCALSSYVDDQRFPADSIKYIVALHNHLNDDVLSPDDLSFLLDQGVTHGLGGNGSVQLSAVAFFSNDVESPRCDGFYQYLPLTGQILKWTRVTRWMCEQTHRVEWDRDFRTPHITDAKAPCFKETTP
jgi:hypothetical protein